LSTPISPADRTVFGPRSFFTPVINLFIQQAFTPLTVKGEGSHVYIDEFGIVTPILGCFLAAAFYLKARADGLTGQVQADGRLDH